MRSYSALNIAIRITLIVMLAEILVTLVIEAIPNSMSAYQIALLDAAIMAILAIPPISYYVIKPFIKSRSQALTQCLSSSLTDPLTGLANQHMVMEHLNRIVAGCTRHQEYCAILLIDLDGFKNVNEQFSYETGNEVLIEISRRLQATIRANDILGRSGADVFIILLERLVNDAGDRSKSIMQIARKLIAVIDMPIAVKRQSVHLSASVGIRLLGGDAIDSNIALSEAQMALRKAKSGGGSQAIIY